MTTTTTEPPTGGEAPPVRGVRRWLRDWLWPRQRFQPRIDVPLTLLTPAKGDGFDFDVRVSLIWTGPKEIDAEELRRRVQPHETVVKEAIAGQVRCVARRFPPNQPAEAERSLAEELHCLAHERRPDAGEEDQVDWSTLVSVDLVDAVKVLQQEFWAQRLRQAADEEFARVRQDADDRFSRDRVDELRKLVALWREFLGDLNVDNPEKGKPSPSLARHLARLAARPGEAAQTVDALTRDWEQQSGLLLRVVEQAVVTHQNLNTYEFLMSYESALAELLRHIGSRPVELGGSVLNGDGPE
jgi:hypothetical protein